jgi:sodium-dependent phosphate cotransporter
LGNNQPKSKCDLCRLMLQPPNESQATLGPWQRFVRQGIPLIGALLLFFLAIKLLTGAFSLLGGKSAEALLQVAENPFIGLFLGILATAIVQSSSVTTSMIVTIVAAGQLSLSSAVPMIMGANIGTSVTSTIIALGYIGNRKEYQKAISGATLHDLFNIITVVLLLGLELGFGLLSSASVWMASLITPRIGIEVGGLLFFLTDLAEWIIQSTSNASYPDGNPVLCLLLGIIGVLGSLQLLSTLLKRFIIGRIQRNIDRYIFGSSFRSIMAGFVSTAAVQSSSVTTSLMVPLVATSKVSLTRAFPFLMGANIGTTTTTLLAAIFVGANEPELAQASLAIAFAHVLFNLFGVLVMFPSERIRLIPIRIARKLGMLTLESRFYGVLYVLVLFFLLPMALIWLFQAL